MKSDKLKGDKSDFSILNTYTYFSPHFYWIAVPETLVRQFIQ